MSNCPDVGIDFGTTNSVVAVYRDGEPVVVPSNGPGRRIVPSVISYPDTSDEREQPWVGELAENTGLLRPERTIRSVKRSIGTDQTFDVGDRELRPQQIAGDFIRQLRQGAASTLKVKADALTDAVITVPAYYDEQARQATREAGRLAGFEDVSLITEPAAATLDVWSEEMDNIRLLVVDLGGGTLDISVIEAVAGQFEVLAHGGNRHLGGDDWDLRLRDQIVERIQEETGRSPLEQGLHDSEVATSRRRAKLTGEARQLKHRLAEDETATLRLPNLMIGSDTYHFETTVARSTLTDLTEDLTETLVHDTAEVLDRAGVDSRGLTATLLTGGATQLPQIVNAVDQLIETPLRRPSNPATAVARGAAVHAADSKVFLSESLPISVGIRTDPDLFDPLIERGTSLPASETKLYRPVEAPARAVRIDVLQGERPVASENKLLRRFYLEDIMSTGGHSPWVEVEFSIDREGLLTVSASDRNGTSVTETVDITGPEALNDEQIDDHIETATAEREADHQRVQTMEATRDARKTVHYAQEFLRQYDEVLPNHVVEGILNHIEEVQSLLATGQHSHGEGQPEETGQSPAVTDLAAAQQALAAALTTGARILREQQSQDLSSSHTSPDSTGPNNGLDARRAAASGSAETVGDPVDTEAPTSTESSRATSAATDSTNQRAAARPAPGTAVDSSDSSQATPAEGDSAPSADESKEVSGTESPDSPSSEGTEEDEQGIQTFAQTGEASESDAGSTSTADTSGQKTDTDSDSPGSERGTIADMASDVNARRYGDTIRDTEGAVGGAFDGDVDADISEMDLDSFGADSDSQDGDDTEAEDDPRGSELQSTESPPDEDQTDADRSTEDEETDEQQSADVDPVISESAEKPSPDPDADSSLNSGSGTQPESARDSGSASDDIPDAASPPDAPPSAATGSEAADSPEPVQTDTSMFENLSDSSSESGSNLFSQGETESEDPPNGDSSSDGPEAN